jgi:ferredoxin
MLKRLLSDPTDLMNIPVGVLKGSSITPPREVDKSTYKIIGEVERADERDNVHIRMGICQPGSFKYEDYYNNLHPEYKDVDKETTAIAAKSSNRRQEKSPEERLLSQLEIAGFYAAQAISLPVAVNTRFRQRQEATGHYDILDEIGQIAPIKMDPEEMSLKIKALGLHLGAAKVRIAKLNQSWVYSHTFDPWGQAPDLNYKYMICMIVLQDPFLIGGGFMHSGQALEVGYKYSFASMISIMVANLIKRLGWPARACPTFNASYLVCPTFIDAGIGEDGRCGMVVTKEFGNNWRPAAVATDLPLISDKPVDFGLQDFCDKCKICADACLSGAIPKGSRERVREVWKWQIDPLKCQRFWMSSGYNCAMCQKACPWNHNNNLLHNSIREVAERFKNMRKLLITLEEIFYKNNKKPRPDPKWMVKKLLDII